MWTTKRPSFQSRLVECRLAVRDCYLLSDSFKAKMSHLVDDIVRIYQRNAGVDVVFLEIVHHDSVAASD